MNDTLSNSRSELDLDGVRHAIICGLEEGVIVFDRHGGLLASNPAAEQILGLSLKELHGRSLTDSRWQMIKEDGFAFGENLYPTALCLCSGRTETAVMGVSCPAGPLRWLQVKAQPISQEGRITHVVSSFSDVTEQREARRRREQEARFRATLLDVVTESLTQGLDESFYQRLLEGAVQAIPGVQAGSLLLREGERCRFIAAVNYDLDALRHIYLLPEEMYWASDVHTPLLVYGFDNHNVPEERRSVIDGVGRADKIKVCMAIPVLLHGEPIAYFSLDNFESDSAFDSETLEMGRIFAQQAAALWQRFKLEAETRRMAFYDTLTGLPNRSLLYDRLRQAVAQRRTKDQPLAVMFIDLDNFKDVNDTYGHDVGDALLQGVAARFGNIVRQGDTLSRWGGDEFVLLTELERPEDAAAIAEKLLEALKQPFLIGGRELQVHSSVGVELTWGKRASVEEVIKHADIALYRAKTLGKNTYRFFTQDLNQRLRARLVLEHDLREALAHDALTLDYQPRFNVQTGCITGVEALARWVHPERGSVSPGEFIPVAEETGMILLLGQQVLDLAVRQAKTWHTAGRSVRVAVNVSTAQLASPDFVTVVRQTLKRYLLDPCLLELEITESAAMKCVEDTISRLQEFRNLGIRVALDDFGTGYSSLTYLKRLPLDVLKLDQAFVRDLGNSSAAVRDARLVRNMIEQGRTFGLTVVAEGVETREQLELLQTFGCHEAQGYYLARPQPALGMNLDTSPEHLTIQSSLERYAVRSL